MKRSNLITIRSILIIMVFQISLFATSIIDLDRLKKKDGKHTILFFHMNYCPYCERFISVSLNNPNIKEQIKKDFNYIDININEDGDIKFDSFKGDKYHFSQYFDINFYPTILFLDNNNEIVYTMRGYRDQKTFKNILRYIKTKSYNDLDFVDYK